VWGWGGMGLWFFFFCVYLLDPMSDSGWGVVVFFGFGVVVVTANSQRVVSYVVPPLLFSSPLVVVNCDHCHSSSSHAYPPILN